MNEIVVRVERLKSKLNENMKTHEADFEIAWEAYTKAVVENIEQILKAAKKIKKGQQINLNVNLSRPENHVQDYVRALEMLEWHQAEEISVTEHEFSQFVQDDWGWKQTFSAHNAFYTGSVSPSKIQ